MEKSEFLASLEKSDLGTRSPASEVGQARSGHSWGRGTASSPSPREHPPNEPVAPFRWLVWTLKSLAFGVPAVRPAVDPGPSGTLAPPSRGGGGGVWCVGSLPLLRLLRYLRGLPGFCAGFAPTKWSVGNIRVQVPGLLLTGW